MMGQVHLAKPDDVRTACGRVALLEDGTRRLETDTDARQISCATCARILKRYERGVKHESPSP